MYDIADNSLRYRISEICKDSGLVRFQKSVFFGETESSTVRHLGSFIESEIVKVHENSSSDSVLIFTICDSCMDKKIVFGKDFSDEEFRKKNFVILG